MPETCVPDHELQRLRTRRDALRLQAEILRLQAETGETPLAEGFGDLVDRREYLADVPDFISPAGGPGALLSDRQAGKFAPVYETEHDLARLRARARSMAALTPMHAGVLDALANYVIGAGFTFTARPVIAHRAPDEFDRGKSIGHDTATPSSLESQASGLNLASAVQWTVDRFLDDNDFCGSLDREAHARSREDGEAFLVLTPRAEGRIDARFVECEQVVEPADARPLEDWLGCGEEFPSCWSFGIHTPAGETNRALGYHVVADSAGRDWDYIPAGRMEHFKRNVSANAKRGVSDFLPVLGDLEREARLRCNTAHGAALQAAIAWILELPPGTTRTQARGVAGDTAIATYPRPTASGWRDQDVSSYPPGTVLRPSAGITYKPGPMGSERNPNFLLVGQYLLRAVAVRWNIPEYLISADASNANYASSLVAESPFVKAREADQQFYKRHFRSLLWKVVRLAWEAGAFARHAVSWETLMSLVEIKIDAPAVATRDALKLAQTQELQMRLGILSPRTAAAQAGLEYDAERQQGACEMRNSECGVRNGGSS